MNLHKLIKSLPVELLNVLNRNIDLDMTLYVFLKKGHTNK